MKQTEQENTATTIEEEGKKIAVIAYLTFIGLIIAFVMNNDKKLPFAQYHIAQSLGLVVTGIGLGVIGMVPILGWFISIFGSFVVVYMWFMGLLNAINGKEKPIPILGRQYEKWFANL
ncbi:DUF4870 domain-containing protein [Maribacter thermophilus]|uniref:DUF4870 domain-containing protein n=1 Tax=Maribacter thermophilus TaxID=1197874 RepID=UPI000640DA62|nr:membrane protein [Maribacter thermophilus]